MAIGGQRGVRGRDSGRAGNVFDGAIPNDGGETNVAVNAVTLQEGAGWRHRRRGGERGFGPDPGSVAGAAFCFLAQLVHIGLRHRCRI